VSTSKYLMSFGTTSISWRSCKYSILENSTTEAAKEIVWLTKILEDLQGKQVNVTPLLIDNTYAIKLSRNPRFHDRTYIVPQVKKLQTSSLKHLKEKSLKN
jgi:hypothetical protein